MTQNSSAITLRVVSSLIVVVVTKVSNMNGHDNRGKRN
jgi:hypothetical protein